MQESSLPETNDWMHVYESSDNYESIAQENVSLIDLTDLQNLLDNLLQLGERAAELELDSPLLGDLPEFDSMAVIGVITELEELYGIVLEDDEIDGEIFITVGSLLDFINSKLAD